MTEVARLEAWEGCRDCSPDKAGREVGREGEREEGREGKWVGVGEGEGGRVGGREGGRVGGREGGREGGLEGEGEGGIKGGRGGAREGRVGGREGGRRVGGAWTLELVAGGGGEEVRSEWVEDEGGLLASSLGLDLGLLISC